MDFCPTVHHRHKTFTFILLRTNFHFFRLKAIAGVQSGHDGNLVKTEKPFICPSDGHFGDPNDCTKFYKCAHGTPVIEYCPATLFWNQGERLTTTFFFQIQSREKTLNSISSYVCVKYVLCSTMRCNDVCIPLKIAQITFLHTFYAFPGFHSISYPFKISVL